MTGAKHLITSGSDLTFQLPRNFAKDGINAVRITLNAADTYDMKFFKVGTARSGYAHKDIVVLEGIYGDSLAEIFEQKTGLATHL